MGTPVEPQGPAPRRRRNTIIVVIAMSAIIAVVAILAIIIAMQETDEGTEALTGAAVDAGALPQTVPFDTVAGHIVVDVIFDEADAAFPMIFDSGAPSIISDDLAERYAGEPVGVIKAASIDETVTSSDIVPLPTLGLGGAVFSGVAALKGFLEPDNPLSCISENGLIGSNVMRTGVWQIDYETGELTVAPAAEGLDHIDGAISLAFERATTASPSPVLELPVGDGTLRFIVDTGSDGWLTVNPADLEGTGFEILSDAPALTSLGAGSGGLHASRLVWAAADVQLGETKLESVPVATTETLARAQGNIGNAFLSNYVVTIDWNDDTLYLDPVAAELALPVPASAKYGWDGDGFVVSTLVEGAPGLAGLAVGDAISAIDGVDVSTATRDEFCARLANDDQMAFEMTIAGDPPTTVEVGPVEDFFESLA